MDLAERGFRFVARGSEITWRHPTDSRPGDVDCTDMTELELEQQICRTVGIFKFCIVPA